MQKWTKTKLGEILLNEGSINAEQLEWALKEQKKNGKHLGNLLLDSGYVKEDDIIKALAIQMEMPHVDLKDYPIAPNIIELVPEKIARTHNIVPLCINNDKLGIATSNPLDIEAIDAVQKITKMRVELFLTNHSSIQKTLDLIYGNTEVSDLAISIGEATNDVDLISQEKQNDSVAEEYRQSNQAPIVRMVNLVLNEAIKQRTSDIHFEPQEQGLNIRYRIDGVLHQVRTLPRQLQASIISRIKIMAELDIAEKRLPQDGRISIKIRNKTVDLRISTIPVENGERVVMRVLDKSTQTTSIGELGFDTSEFQMFESMLSKPYGIILVTGPTGSGKTTTLYSALEHIKSPETNIMTCEDPIEYKLDGISQSTLNTRAGLTFAVQLRAILRQDPDVILVGEIRDHETASIAFRAAMTGHLVLSTLHCNDAPSAIARLVDMGVEPFLVGSSIVGVIAQRLVRRLCPYCKESYKPTQAELASIGIFMHSEDVNIYKPIGCDKCDNRGFSGRLAVFELMKINEEMRNLALQHPSSDQVRELALNSGMKTMREFAAQKVLAGLTTIDEVRRKVYIESDIEFADNQEFDRLTVLTKRAA